MPSGGWGDTSGMISLVSWKPGGGGRGEFRGYWRTELGWG